MQFNNKNKNYRIQIQKLYNTNGKYLNIVTLDLSYTWS